MANQPPYVSFQSNVQIKSPAVKMVMDLLYDKVAELINHVEWHYPPSSETNELHVLLTDKGCLYSEYVTLVLKYLDTIHERVYSSKQCNEEEMWLRTSYEICRILVKGLASVPAPTRPLVPKEVKRTIGSYMTLGGMGSRQRKKTKYTIFELYDLLRHLNSHIARFNPPDGTIHDFDGFSESALPDIDNYLDQVADFVSNQKGNDQTVQWLRESYHECRRAAAYIKSEKLEDELQDNEAVGLSYDDYTDLEKRRIDNTSKWFNSTRTSTPNKDEYQKIVQTLNSISQPR